MSTYPRKCVGSRRLGNMRQSSRSWSSFGALLLVTATLMGFLFVEPTARAISPGVRLLSPNGGEVLTGGVDHPLVFELNRTDELNSIQWARLYYRNTSADPWSLIFTLLGPPIGEGWNNEPFPLPAYDSTTAELRLDISVSGEGVYSDAIDAPFTVDSTAPVLSGVKTGARTAYNACFDEIFSLFMMCIEMAGGYATEPSNDPPAVAVSQPAGGEVWSGGADGALAFAAAADRETPFLDEPVFVFVNYTPAVVNPTIFSGYLPDGSYTIPWTTPGFTFPAYQVSVTAVDNGSPRPGQPPPPLRPLAVHHRQHAAAGGLRRGAAV